MLKKSFAAAMALILCLSLAGCCCLTTAKKEEKPAHPITNGSTTTTAPTEELHVHAFVSTVTTEANCIRTGEMTYSCDCGYSYTEEIPCTTTHNWEAATCETPQQCKDCDYIYTSALGHNYVDHYCTRCRQVDPDWANGLGKCSLYFKNSFPLSLSDTDYWGDTDSTLSITSASYEFAESYWDDEVDLTITVSGKKTYDYYGDNNSSYQYIYYVLYDNDGYVEKTGHFYTDFLYTGDTFTETFTISYLEPGAYTLELLEDSYY